MRGKELQDVQGYEGSLFRDLNTGNIINLRDFVPFETAERLEGINWALDAMDGDRILTGWRFTCASWPKNLVEVQQAVRVQVDGRTKATQSLSSLLTLADQHAVRDMDAEDLGLVWAMRTVRICVILSERPVEGAGLRVHLRGLLRRLAAS
jgi:hypothetical protein